MIASAFACGFEIRWRVNPQQTVSLRTTHLEEVLKGKRGLSWQPLMRHCGWNHQQTAGRTAQGCAEHHLHAHAKLVCLIFVGLRWFHTKPSGRAGALLQSRTMPSLKPLPSLPTKCPDQLSLHGVQGERPRPLGHQKAAAESVCRGSIGV